MVSVLRYSFESDFAVRHLEGAVAQISYLSGNASCIPTAGPNLVERRHRSAAPASATPRPTPSAPSIIPAATDTVPEPPIIVSAVSGKDH
jgi:hypothetical protein